MLRAASSLAVCLAAIAAGCIGAPGTDAEGAPVVFEAVELATSHGDITLILFPDETPKTFAFFTGLVDAGYYDGREFNRVIPGFVIQEVDRAGGATDQPEKVAAEFGTRAMFSGGAVGIARDTDPDSGSSEFFIMDFATSHLYGNYTAFAQVVEGLDVVHAIARVEAIETTPVQQVPVATPVHDRVAVQPGVIETATRTRFTMSADEAARYPLVVGESTRLENGRATLEWPRDLAVGRESVLTWYVFTRDQTVPGGLDASLVRVVDPDGAAVEVAATGDPADARIRHFTWTPRVPGTHVIDLVVDGSTLASATVPVA